MRIVRLAVATAAVASLAASVALSPAAADRLAGSPTGGAPLSTDLDGAQEIDPQTGEPGAGDPDATGHVSITINPGQRVACYELAHDVDPAPFGFHIHDGHAGENGPIVVGFFTQMGAEVPPAGCVGVDRAVATAILADPAAFYVNLHNADFPAGAIRGQLSPSSR